MPLRAPIPALHRELRSGVYAQESRASQTLWNLVFLTPGEGGRRDFLAESQLQCPTLLGAAGHLQMRKQTTGRDCGLKDLGKEHKAESGKREPRSPRETAALPKGLVPFPLSLPAALTNSFTAAKPKPQQRCPLLHSPSSGFGAAAEALQPPRAGGTWKRQGRPGKERPRPSPRPSGAPRLSPATCRRCCSLSHHSHSPGRNQETAGWS